MEQNISYSKYMALTFDMWNKLKNLPIEMQPSMYVPNEVSTPGVNVDLKLQSEIIKNLEWSCKNLTPDEIRLLQCHVWNVDITWCVTDKSRKLKSLQDSSKSILSNCLNIANENRNKLFDIFERIPPTTEEITLYSGAEFPISLIKFGKQLNLPYFTSSYEKRTADLWSGNHRTLYILTILPSSKIISLDGISIRGNKSTCKDYEVLLNPNAILHITKIEQYNHILILHVNYLDH